MPTTLPICSHCVGSLGNKKGRPSVNGHCHRFFANGHGHSHASECVHVGNAYSDTILTERSLTEAPRAPRVTLGVAGPHNPVETIGARTCVLGAKCRPSGRKQVSGHD